MLIFYDFEVFEHDWLVVFKEVDDKKISTTKIINDREKLESYHSKNKNKIWIGYNSRHYDQYILKAILCDFDPKLMSDWIIVDGNAGWQFSKFMSKIKVNNYDVMTTGDRGLKSLEGFMGNDIKESSVPFNLDRKLTEEEIKDVLEYCNHDVEQTIEVFLQRISDFEAQIGLIKLANEDAFQINLIGKTKPQMAAHILQAHRKSYDDEFDITIPKTIKLKKYKSVQRWYQEPSNMSYYDSDFAKNQLYIDIAGVPHILGWGGIHGAIPKYNGEGHYINIDVVSYYPSLMIEYNLLSRSVENPKKYEEIYTQRLKCKAEKNPLQAPLKIVLNSTYGAMKDSNNALYDPLQANQVCVHGQLLLVDLMEKLEPHCQIIQSNTDGVLIKLHDYNDYYLIDDVCHEWEKRTRMKLEFEEFEKVFQKDVNNYVLVDKDGNYKSKGGYVKQLHNLDYDLPIVNKALINKMVLNIDIEDTINNETMLKEFQLVSKIGGKYDAIYHGEVELKEKCIRVFASKNKSDLGVRKLHKKTGTRAKITNSPPNCFIVNGNVNGKKIPKKLDKKYYIEMAKRRLEQFGVR